MAGFIPSEYPSHFGELQHAARKRQAPGRYSAASTAVDALGLGRIGASVTAVAARVRAAVAARRQARCQREELGRGWNLALRDARAIADRAKPWRDSASDRAGV
jgi:hypothetical protein